MKTLKTEYSESEVDAFMKRFWQILMGCFAVFIIPLLIYVFYMEHRLGKFEQSLRYQFPKQQVAADSEGDQQWKSLDISEGQVIYVPAYSHVYHEDGKPQLLTVTLSVRNTSRQRNIVVNSVRYFDTNGKPIKSYLDKPISLAALETAEFLVERDDHSGGSGANFLVEWHSAQPVSEPIVEAIMIDTSGQQGISFARSGRVIEQRVVQEPPQEADAGAAAEEN